MKIEKDIYERARQNMVTTQLVERGIKDKKVLDAMLRIPRHLFVEEALSSQAYSDFPLPIGEKQTISQPFMVAYMTEALNLSGGERVLEIGYGCGYQSAVLSLLCYKVYAIERISKIASIGRKNLDRLMCANVVTKVGDGTFGWKDEAPFDAIIVAAAAPMIPPAYVEQLSVGGRLVIPVGTEFTQALMRVTKKADDDVVTETLGGCRFVKLVGKYGWHENASGT